MCIKNQLRRGVIEALGGAFATPAARYAYDPELDLWAILDRDGFTVSHETFKFEAVRTVRRLNGVRQ